MDGIIWLEDDAILMPSLDGGATLIRNNCDGSAQKLHFKRLDALATWLYKNGYNTQEETNQ